MQKFGDMARLGKLPVQLVNGVTAEVNSDVIVVNGPKGSLERKIANNINVEVTESGVLVTPKGNSKQANAMQGTMRAHVANMVHGVTEGWKRQLEINGPGFRAEARGKELVLTLGYSHPVIIKAGENMSFSVEKNLITIEGIDKEAVGQTAALAREARKPNVYTGAGVKYLEEIIRRKAGKQAGSE